MENSQKSLSYAESGVDIKVEESTISALTAAMTFQRKGLGAPLGDIGHYAGLIDFGEYVLALATDGVGSKVLIANEMQRWNTVGIDCIAMNVNDLLAMAIEPIAFVDYLALESHDEDFSRQIGEGLARGAEISRMSIVGGETATLPEIVNGFDLAGTCLGMAKKGTTIAGENVKVGDKLVGIASSGVHSNGYTLVRRIVAESGYSYADPLPDDPSVTIGDALLEPTRIYMEILDLAKEVDIHGLAHITGSGLLKLRRLTELGFLFDNPIKPQPVFDFLRREGNVSLLEMYRTFNMGMGFVVVVDEADVDETVRITGGQVVGEIVEKEKGIRVGDMEVK